MIFSEFLLIFRKTSFKKILNAIKLYSSYLLSLNFKNTQRNAYPITISIEPTSLCNLKCPECPTGREEITRFKGNIDLNVYKTAVDEFAPYLFNLILYFQGEPFLNQDIFKLIEYASVQKNIHTTTSTNGHFLTSENAKKTVLSRLDKLIISIDGTTQEVYETYRKSGNLNTVIEGIKHLVYWKKKLNSKTPFIIIQFLVFKTNEHQLKEIKQLSKDLNVDKLEFKSAQIYDFEINSEMIPTIKKYARYQLNSTGKYEIKSKLKNKCKRLWETSVITNTGDVLPCCFDKGAGYVFGNVKESSFKDIINSSQAKKFRKKLFTNRKQIDICKNCTEGIWK